MTEREALKLALKALEVATTPLAKDRQEVLRAIIAIREALAQPEQEPSELDIWKSRALQAEAVVEKFMAQPEPVIDKSAAVRIATALGWEPKRTWVGLTDEEWEMTHWSPDFRAGAKWAEAKLRSKNT